jgi:hypothetical protein
MHLSAQAADPLELSWSLQHGQHGMSALPDIDISTGIVEMFSAPIAGTAATEMAIRAARIARGITMRGTIELSQLGVNTRSTGAIRMPP